MKSKTTSVLFDAGGTLIHMDRRFVIQTLNDNGVAADLDGFARADRIGRRVVSDILRSADPGTDSSRWFAYAQTIMRELKCEGAALDAVRTAMQARHRAGDLWTYVEEGTTEVLEELLDRGHRIGIVSNADGRVAKFLEKAGLLRYFEVVVDSGVFGVEKPDPRIFHHACEQLGVAPADAFYVGDVYEVDVVGARAAGLEPIFITSMDDGEWDCPVIRSLAELPPLVGHSMSPANR